MLDRQLYTVMIDEVSKVFRNVTFICLLVAWESSCMEICSLLEDTLRMCRNLVAIKRSCITRVAAAICRKSRLFPEEKSG